MTIYHGGSVIVKTPELRYSVRALDFGKGFHREIAPWKN
jgi:hypothetical protein